MLIISFYINFGEDGEGGLEAGFAKGGDLFVAAGFLSHEVVGGKGEDDKSLVAIGFIELLESFVLAGESAAAGGIDDEEGFSLVSSECRCFSLNGGYGNII